jgi:hypothetical protein
MNINGKKVNELTDDELEEVMKELRKVSKFRRDEAKKKIAVKANSDWYFIYEDDYEEDFESGHPMFYIVSKKFFDDKGHLDDDLVRYAIDNDELFIPSDMSECMESCYQFHKKLSVPEAEEILVSWGFTKTEKGWG